MNRQIILASTSPRRRGLFKLFKIKHRAVDSGYREVMRNDLPHHELVKFLAVGKAKAAAKKYPQAVIVAADTIVSFQGKAIGKPKNRREAFKMLKNFSGKIHYEVTGVCVLNGASGKMSVAHDKTKVLFKNLSDQEILKYIATGQSSDKAGAYGPIGHGLNLIASFQGDITTSIGLSMQLVFRGFRTLGAGF